MSRAGLLRLALPLVVAAAAAWAFANALPDRLVLDDRVYVPDALRCTLDELATRVPWTASGVGGPYRPVAMGSLCLEAHWHGGVPWRLHATNVAIHVAATLALYALAVGVVRDLRPATPAAVARVAAAGAALLFALHPVHAEAVDSIFNRSEPLATLAVVAALLWLRRFAATRPLLAWAGVAVAYLAGLLCRESAASLPALALLLLWARGDLRRRDLLLAATLVVPLGAYVALRQHALASMTVAVPHAAIVEGALTPAKRLAYVVTTLWDGARLMAWPAPLRASYDVYEPHALAAGVAVVVGWAVVMALVPRWRGALGLAGGFFVVALLVSTRLVTDLTVAGFAERFLYLPSCGLALGLAVALAAAATSARRAAGAALVVVGVAGALAVQTRARNRDWQDDVRLWKHDVAVAPANGVAWMQLTSRLLATNAPRRVAAICARHAYDPEPANGQLLNNCGIASKELGQWADAERLFRRAIALGEGTNVYVNLASMLARLGRAGEARALFEQAIAQEPTPTMQHVRRGQMYAIVPPVRPAAARAEFEAALAATPGFRPAEDWLARVGGRARTS